MARQILLFCLLAMVMHATQGQTPTCTINMSGNTCACNSTLDDQFVKSSFVALQTQIQQLVSDNAKLRKKVETISAGAKVPNLKQCSRRDMNDNRENGLIWTCEFVKKRVDTVLRLVWNGDIRLMHKGPGMHSCRRWFFSLNGTECSQPKTIDAQLLENARDVNSHKPSYVEGYCRSLPAGAVTVGWNVGDCVNQNGFDVGDSFTGWKQTVRIIIEEVDVGNAASDIV